MASVEMQPASASSSVRMPASLPLRAWSQVAKFICGETEVPVPILQMQTALRKPDPFPEVTESRQA